MERAEEVARITGGDPRDVFRSFIDAADEILNDDHALAAVDRIAARVVADGDLDEQQIKEACESPQCGAMLLASYADLELMDLEARSRRFEYDDAPAWPNACNFMCPYRPRPRGVGF